MARFEKKTVTILDADGAEREYEVIVDRASYEVVKVPSCGIDTVTARGFIRCHGKHYVGTFGQHTPIFGGSEEDTYYGGVSLFDGEWMHSRSNVTKDSGTGRLFAELEEFSESASAAVLPLAD